MARIPKYRRHTNGIAFVEWRRKRHYLPGKYNSPKSREAYRQFLLANALASPDPKTLADIDNPETLTVAGLLGLFLNDAKARYGGDMRGEYGNFRQVAKAIQGLEYVRLRVHDFGPVALRGVRDYLVLSGNSRGYINSQIRRLRAVFKWGVTQELVAETHYRALMTVPWLRRGEARDNPDRQPVYWECVEPVLAHLTPVVAAMVRLQWLTGARSGSICEAKPEQFTHQDDLMEWRPRHKQEHKQKDLVLYLGPQGMAVIAPYLNREPDAHCFSPRESDTWFRQQGTTKEVRPNRRLNTCYTSNTYREAVLNGQMKLNNLPILRKNPRKRERLKEHGYEPWSPHQLRHGRATTVDEMYDAEAASAVLGHATLDATKIYIRQGKERRKKVARETG